MKIVTFDHPALKTVSTDVPPELFKEVVDIIYPQMRKLMLQHKGCGLAANQIGITRRFFIFQDGLAINPVILKEGLYSTSELEGCLSFPGIHVPVKRKMNVTVRYTNVRGNVIERELSGDVSRCFQHELDHLNGIVIVKAKYDKLPWTAYRK